MTVTIYTAAFLLLCVIFAAVWKRECRGRIILTPFLLFCVMEVTMVWTSAAYALCTGVSEDLYATLVVLSSTFAFLAGYVLARDMVLWPQGNPIAFWTRPMLPASPHRHAFAIIVCAIMLLLLGLFFYQGIPPIVTSFNGLLGEGSREEVASFAAEYRLKLTKGHYFGQAYRGQGLIRIVMATGWPLLTSISWLLFLKRRTLPWLASSLVLMALCLLFIAGDGTRGPFAFSMIAVLVVLSLAVSIRLRTYLLFGGAMLVVLLGLSYVKKFSDLESAGELAKAGSQRIVQRVCVGNGYATIEVIELVRSGQIALRHGRVHLTRLLNSIPGVSASLPLSYELFLILRPNREGTTFLSMTYLGKLYADFGWFGSVVGFFAIGLLAAVATQFLFSKRKTVLSTAMIGLLCLELGQLGLKGPIPLVAHLLVIVVIGAFYAACLGVAGQAGANYPRPSYSGVTAA